MPQLKPIFQHVDQMISQLACLTLFIAISILSLDTGVLASTMGTADIQREDRTMGTFTEGMQIGKDEETGDTILRSAPSPSNFQNNATDNNALPPAINIEITPQLKKNQPRKK